jgi:hypothetical protein
VTWKLSLNVIFLFLCLCFLCIYRDGYCVARVPTATPLVHEYWQFHFLFYVSRIFPDKNMESTVERKLSLGTLLCSYGRIFCHM